MTVRPLFLLAVSCFQSRVTADVRAHRERLTVVWLKYKCHHENKLPSGWRGVGGSGEMGWRWGFAVAMGLWTVLWSFDGGRDF